MRSRKRLTDRQHMVIRKPRYSSIKKPAIYRFILQRSIGVLRLRTSHEQTAGGAAISGQAGDLPAFFIFYRLYASYPATPSRIARRLAESASRSDRETF